MWRRNLYQVTKTFIQRRSQTVATNGPCAKRIPSSICNSTVSRFNFSSARSWSSMPSVIANANNSTMKVIAMIGGIVTGVTVLSSSDHIVPVLAEEDDDNRSINSNTTEGAQVDAKNSEEIHVERPRTVVSIYLNNETKQKLKEDFPKLFANERYDHLTIYHNPKDTELKPVYKLLGNEFSIQPLAHVSNDSSQVLYCQIVKKEDGSRNIQSNNKYPHVTLSFSDKTDASASNLLLQRVDSRGVLKVAAGSSSFKWHGVLPVWKDETGKLHAATRVYVKSVKGSINYVLDGTLCTNRHWKKLEATQSAEDEDASKAAASITKKDAEGDDVYFCDKPTCGFCEFMKGGPCRDVFIKWEDCVDKCNDVSADFVDECTSETMALKECIDANQEYYGILNQPPTEEGEGERTEGEDNGKK